MVDVIAIATLTAACGSSATVSAPSADATGASTIGGAQGSAIAGPPRPWAELEHAEKQAYMVRVVLPRMTAIFQEHDAERYAGFDCATCHGADATARADAMPSPSLLPLHPTGSEGQHETVRRHPEAVRFMFNRVLPAMQQLLGAEPFDATTGEGLTCYACHPHAE
jgi:hypothetical protein